MSDGTCCGGHGNAAACKCPHHMMIPLFIVLIGLAFLLQSFDVISVATLGYAWPILIILIGLQKMFGGRCKCCGQKA